MSECLDDIFLVCLIMSAQYLLNHATIFLKTKLGIVVCYRVNVSCGKISSYLQCQGHSGGLYNQNMTVFTISSKLLVHLQPSLV